MNYNNIRFSHSVKTGGTSIVHMLRSAGLIVPHTHRPLPSLAQVKEQGIDFSFATVRNPYDWFLGKYNYFKRINEKYTSVNKFLNALEKGMRKTDAPILWLVPQHVHVKNDTYEVDEIIRVENFEEDCKRVFGKMGLDIPVLHKNKTKTKKVKTLTTKQKERIYKLYEKDFVLLGYEK